MLQNSAQLDCICSKLFPNWSVFDRRRYNWVLHHPTVHAVIRTISDLQCGYGCSHVGIDEIGTVGKVSLCP